MANLETLVPETGCSLYSDAPTGNVNHVGDATNRALGESNISARVARWLLKFAALSDGTIPSNAIVVSAVLGLRVSADQSSNARTCRVYRSKRAWNTAQATWNIYSTGNNWQTAGGFGADDCEQTDIGSRAFTATETLNEFKEFTLNSFAIQAIISGVWTNNGFLLKFDTEADDGYVFNTIGNATPEYRPYLIVTYTFGGGAWFEFFAS